VSTLFQDIKFGLRLLLKDRSFTITAVLTLAVCIGANAAMFSVVRSVLLKPLPFPNSERVVLFLNSYPRAGIPRSGTSIPDYFDRLAGVPALTTQALFRREGMTFGEADGAERLTTIRATPSFFTVVAVPAIRGRVFNDADGQDGQNSKALLTYGFWRRHMGARDSVVGEKIQLNGQPYEVVGVLPASFSFLQDDVDLFIPAAFVPDDKTDGRRHNNNLQMIGMTSPDASQVVVQAQVDAVNARNDERLTQFHQILKDAGFRTLVVNLHDDLVRDIKAALYLLWGGVLFVLVIGCVNLANLMMVRAAGRSREMATRHAIGGELGRLARQLLTETTVLSIVGGTAGVLLAWWGTRSVAALNLDQLPRGYEIRLDWLGLVFALVITVAVGLILGVAPAVRLRYMNLNSALREESRGGTSGRLAQRARRVLAMAQVAIALILLIGAGLLLASFESVLHLDFGFNAANVQTATVNIPGSTYSTPESRAGFAQRALEGLRGIPGVTAAGAATAVPFSGNQNSSVIMGEGHVMKSGESLLAPALVIASDGYFESLQIPMIKGRAFTAQDTQASTKVAIIDQELAERFWPGQDAVGRRLYRPSDPNDITKVTPQTPYFLVVGIARNVVVADPAPGVASVGTYYFPISQTAPGGMTFTIRMEHPSPTIGSDIKRVVAGIDQNLPVYRVQTMQEWIDRALVGRRAPTMIAAGFSVVALFLAAIGIYGVLAYGVAERRRELGVRMALGGSTGSVFRIVLTDGIVIVGAGLFAGLVGSYFIGRLMQAMLFGVTPMSPMVIGVVTLLLAGVAFVASGIPALRASRINPAVVLGK